MIAKRLQSITALPPSALDVEHRVLALCGAVRLGLWRSSPDVVTALRKSTVPLLTLGSEDHVVRICEVIGTTLRAHEGRAWEQLAEIALDVVNFIDRVRMSTLATEQLVQFVSFLAPVVELAGRHGPQSAAVNGSYLQTTASRSLERAVAQLDLLQRASAVSSSKWRQSHRGLQVADALELCEAAGCISRAAAAAAEEGVVSKLFGRDLRSSLRAVDTQIVDSIVREALAGPLATRMTVADRCRVVASLASSHPNSPTASGAAQELTTALSSEKSLRIEIPPDALVGACRASRQLSAGSLYNVLLRVAARQVAVLMQNSPPPIIDLISCFDGAGLGSHVIPEALVADAVVATLRSILSVAPSEADFPSRAELAGFVDVADRLAYKGYLPADLALLLIGTTASRVDVTELNNDVFVPLVVIASRALTPDQRSACRASLDVVMTLIAPKHLTAPHVKRLAASARRGVELPPHLTRSRSQAPLPQQPSVELPAAKSMHHVTLTSNGTQCASSSASM